MKSEPDVFSFEDLKARPKQTEPWDGVRNYQARNFMRDSMEVGDLILFPNYLMHTAYPFVVDGERRSFSFNVELDKKVADVFHD